jgi:predicted transcriptional regulator
MANKLDAHREELLRLRGTMSQRALAAKFGVSQSHVNKYLQRLDGEPEPESRPADDPEVLREVQREAELSHLRRETTRLQKQLANREAVVERIIEASRVPVQPPRLRVRRQSSKLPVRSAVLPIYDIQYGQLVQPSDVPFGLGEYSASVFDRRAERYVEAVTGSMLDYAASHRIDELIVVLGGDLVEGADIFAGQAWQLDRDPVRQSVELAGKLEALLRELVRFAREDIGVERIGVYSVPGNHGKVGGKRSGATPTTMSWDHLTTVMLQDKLRAEPIDGWGIEPAGALLFETAGHTFLAVHGDEIRGWGGLPFYGLTRFDGRAIRMARLVYDYCLLGHHHQQAAIPNGSGGEFLVSGDWVGGNNLSKHIVAASRPQQRLLFVSRKWGVTENLPIYFTPSTAGERPHVYQLGAEGGRA